MFFDKKKYIVKIAGGKGICTTDKMRGRVEYLIVRPDEHETEWDLKVVDRDGDELLEIENWVGRMDDRKGIPVGRDSQEKLTLQFSNVSYNRPIKVIFIIKELDG